MNESDTLTTWIAVVIAIVFAWIVYVATRTPHTNPVVMANKKKEHNKSKRRRITK